MKQSEMLRYMPHRGRNVIIDDFKATGESSGEGYLTIAAGDPAGRDLFLVNSPEGPRYSHVFLVEHVALTSILCIQSDMGDGRIAYFSKITKYVRRGDAPAGTPLVSRLTRGRDRGEFRAFDAVVETTSGKPLLTVSFMAFLAPRGAPLPARDEPVEDLDWEQPDPALFPCYPAPLVLLAPPQNGQPARAVYPEDHPLCEGHFPGAPVMMGMSHWQAVAQAAAFEAPPGHSVLSGSGNLTRTDGRVVVEVAGLEVAVDKNEAGQVMDLRLQKTKRVAFRERVLPGDGYLAAFEPATG
jgi:3-hydroxymyristoyl/3-hydroxydecanoyl-(acyl carrier protein) dehydratase